jgi:16S rRNA (guanine527-N7)-methyltransferase
VLAAARPAASVTLVESEGRKADWLRRAGARFPNVRVVAERSETLARDERDRYPLVTARALGSLPVVMELAAPLLAPGGALVAWRGRRDTDDVDAARVAADELGLSATPDIDVTPFPGVSRYFSVWMKTGETPPRYPRRPGMAAKRPLA